MTETTCSSQNWWENLQESLSQYIPIDLPTEAILIPGLTEVGVSSTGRPARNAWAKWNGPKVYAARWRRWVRRVRWVQRTIFQSSAFLWVVWLPFPGLKVVKICKNDMVLPTWPFQKVTDLIYPWCVHGSHWQPLTSYVRGGGMQIYYVHLWSRRCLLPRDNQMPLIYFLITDITVLPSSDFYPYYWFLLLSYMELLLKNPLYIVVLIFFLVTRFPRGTNLAHGTFSQVDEARSSNSIFTLW